ncbi:MAG: MFS transporter [Gammaproteobacteria bacterium]|nr:MFS transporter [Gammaproteobacteria bacterium]
MEPPSTQDVNDTSTQRTALIIVWLSSFIAPLMLSAVNVALPRIAEGLNANAILLGWVPTAYLLTSAVLLLPFGRIADLHGRKKVFLWGMTVVTVASVLASGVHSAAALIACRVLQGVGASMLFATGVAILSSIYPRERRGAAIGLTVSAVYLGLTCGPLIGGWATQHLSWRGVFLIHVPAALLIILVAFWKLRGEWKDPAAGRLDLPGAAIYAASIIAIMYGVSALPAIHSLVAIIGGVAGVWYFFRFERGRESPLFDVSLFDSNRVFTFSCLASLTTYSSTFGISYLMSLYLQYIQGMTPQFAGMILIAQPAMMALFSPLSGRLSDRLEPRYLSSAGILLIGIGLALLATLTSVSSMHFIVAALMLTGFGVALFSAPNTNAIMGSVEKRSLGVAGGAVSTMRVLGQMFSMGVVSTVFAVLLGPVRLTPENYPHLLEAIKFSLVAAACISVTGIFLSLSRGNVHGEAASR